MACKSCALALWYIWMIAIGGAFARSPGFTHWLITEEGKIEFQIGSPYNLHQPSNLVALLEQEERVSTLDVLRDELLNFRDHFEGFGYYDSFEDSFYGRVPECRTVPIITTFDLYISTVIPLEHKNIRLSDHLDPAHSRFKGEPHCISQLDYSIYALEHLEGVQDRYSLVAPPEKGVFPSVNMKVEMFGNLVYKALEKNETSWVLLDLATLYWRVMGNVPNAIECIRRALHYSPRDAADIAYLNLANALHRSHMSRDAMIPLKMALEISPDVNVLHYTLANVYVSMGEFNDSVSEYRYSLSLEPSSEPVLSVYSSVLCEMRKIEASEEYGRKLDETQAKLDEFYDKVELVKKTHKVEKGHRGQWDIDTSRRHAERDDKMEEDREREGGESEEEREGERGGNMNSLVVDEDISEDVTTETMATPIDDISNGEDDKSSNGMSNTVMPHSRGNSRLKLVLRPLSECGECQSCDPAPSLAPNSNMMTSFQIEWPVCRLPSPFLNYSRHTSGYCAETTKDCAEIEKQGKPGVNFCEVKGQSTRVSYTQDNDVSMTTRVSSSSLNCAIDERNGESDCLKKLQEQLRLAEQRRVEQREKMMKKETKSPSKNKKKPVPTTSSPPAETPQPSPSSDSTKPDLPEVKKHSKKSSYSTIYRNLEFLPYNPLPSELDDLIFPDKSRPLALFDDPFWPGKANCISLAETLEGTTSSMSAYTGTYLSPKSKGIDTDSYFKIVPYPVPPYLRQQPRCTDIVELPFSLQAYDHLYPVQYRSQLQANKRHSENGLKQILINAVSEAMGHTMSFEESGEAVYAAMVKNGPNWSLFVMASLYWRVSGDPKHSIECLRRALHYGPNIYKDVSYVAMANVFHRHGYMSEAVIAARASLDVIEDSPVGHYTMAGIYLTLRDYTGTSLHLRASLHMQPAFEHALSALRLVRCYLKFQEEYEHLRRLLNQPEGKHLLPYENTFAVDLTRALETLKGYEKIRQPPAITKPEEVILREGGRDTDGYFTGEDAIRYMTNLAMIRDQKRERQAQEGEKERKEREAIEKRLRDEIMRVENDGSLEEFIKKKREEEGENEFVKQVQYEPNQLDITPLMKQVANRILSENNNNYDPQLIAHSHAEIEAELRDIVITTARAIANKQSPVQQTAPVRIIPNDDRSPMATNDDDNDENSEKEAGSKQKEKNDVKRYPGFRPWPTLDECTTIAIPKILVFTSTWLSVTAKKIRVVEHVDFEAPIEDNTLKPYCSTNIPDLENLFSNLASMNGMMEIGNYKPERGLIEVFTNLSGSYETLESIASRINISTAKNDSSWILSNLAVLYWRIHGDGEQAINCLKHAIHYSGRSNLEVALVSLANVLYRLGYDSDATAVMQYSLEVNPKLVVNHFTMANLLAARGFAAESASYFETTLQYQPRFEPAAERLKAVRCVTLLKHIQETREKEEKRQREYEAELERQLYEHRKSIGHFD